jgi:hypothetical protein
MIDSSKVERNQDHLILVALIRVVPPKMHSTLAIKKIAKEAWEVVNMMHPTVDWVKDVNAQKLLKEFKSMSLHCEFHPCHKSTCTR